uniref:Uncharacterized protein n=1 Tax=Oryza brachyantha TaxID=4533 RepID=J3MXY1_ORYBR
MRHCGRELCGSTRLPAGWGLVGCDAVAFGIAEGRRCKPVGGRGVEAGSDRRPAGRQPTSHDHSCSWAGPTATLHDGRSR